MRIMRFGGKADTVIDTVDMFLATLAKLRLISDQCSDKSWGMAFDRFAENCERGINDR